MVLQSCRSDHEKPCIRQQLQGVAIDQVSWSDREATAHKGSILHLNRPMPLMHPDIVTVIECFAFSHPFQNFRISLFDSSSGPPIRSGAVFRARGNIFAYSARSFFFVSHSNSDSRYVYTLFGCNHIELCQSAIMKNPPGLSNDNNCSITGVNHA